MGIARTGAARWKAWRSLAMDFAVRRGSFEAVES